MVSYFCVWHGSRRWSGTPEIRPSKLGRSEWGAGIYGSTHFTTGQKYAKGGGKVRLLTISQSHCLEQCAIPLSIAQSFVRDKLPRRLWDNLNERLDQLCERMKGSIQTRFECLAGDVDVEAWVPADVLRNLCVNADITSGLRGLELSRFFSENNEFWIVIFDPSLVSASKGFTYEEALAVGHELKSPFEQLTDNARMFSKHQTGYSL
jgi:hypothetical protein